MNELRLRQVKVWQGRSSSGDPIFPSNAARLAEGEAKEIVDYLKNAPVVMRTTTLKRDSISGEDAVVPQSIRSDGEWVWSDEVTYYIDTYLMKPDDDFLVYLRSHPTPPAELTQEMHSKIASELGL